MRPIPADTLAHAHGLLRAIDSRGGRLRTDEFVTEFELGELFPPDLENALGRLRHFLSYARAAGLVREDRGVAELTDVGRRYVRAGEADAPFAIVPNQAEWLRRQLREKHMTDSIYHGLAIGLSLLASCPPGMRVATLDFGRSMAYLGRAGWDNENTLEIQGERHLVLLRDMELIDAEHRLTPTGDQVRGELTLPVHMSLIDIAAQLNPGGAEAVRAAADVEWAAPVAAAPAAVEEEPLAAAPVDEDEGDDDALYHTVGSFGAVPAPAEAPRPPVVPRAADPSAAGDDAPSPVSAPGPEEPAAAESDPAVGGPVAAEPGGAAPAVGAPGQSAVPPEQAETVISQPISAAPRPGVAPPSAGSPPGSAPPTSGAAAPAPPYDAGAPAGATPPLTGAPAEMAPAPAAPGTGPAAHAGAAAVAPVGGVPAASADAAPVGAAAAGAPEAGPADAAAVGAAAVAPVGGAPAASADAAAAAPASVPADAAPVHGEAAAGPTDAAPAPAAVPADAASVRAAAAPADAVPAPAAAAVAGAAAAAPAGSPPRAVPPAGDAALAGAASAPAGPASAPAGPAPAGVASAPAGPAPVGAAPAPGTFLAAGAIRAAAEHAGLRLPDGVYANVAAALAAGKHLVLTGAAGSGKTTLALAIARAAAQAGRAHGATVVTAAPPQDLLVHAAASGRWVIADEFDQAEPEASLAPLSTLLAGIPVTLGDAEVEPAASWRIVATWNGPPPRAPVLRRFAIVTLAAPPADALRALLHQPDPVAAEAVEKLLALGARVGAGVLRDAANHIAVRQAAAPTDAATLADEAFAAYIAPLTDADA